MGELRRENIENFPCKRPLSDSLLEKIKNGSLFGFAQCELIVTDALKSTFSNFPPKIKILASAKLKLKITRKTMPKKFSC